MKTRRIAVVCMAAVFSVPVFSQENIVKAFKRMEKRTDLIKAENHVKDVDKVTREINSTTDAYTFSLGKEDISLIDYVKREFVKDRGAAVKEFDRFGPKTLTLQPTVFSVGSGDLEIKVGSGDPESNYMVMVFNDVKDTVRNRRYVYAMEWKEDGNGGALLSLIADYGVKPEAIKSAFTFDGNPKWDAQWLHSFNLFLKNLKSMLPKINKGELTSFPTQMYQKCMECPVKDPELRKACAGELRAVAEKITSTDANMEKALLLRAADMLDK